MLTALFPSWRFFNRAGWAPKLYYREVIDGEVPQEWTLCYGTPARGLRVLLINPEGNLIHACNSIVERFLMRAQDSSDEARYFGDLIRIANYWIPESIQRYQLRITIREQGEVFVSPVVVR